MRCIEALSRRGRKRAEAPLPNRLTARRALVDSQSQAAPQCRSPRLSPRLTAAAVRRQLMAQQGDREVTLPTADTIGTKWKALGSYP